MVSERIRTMAPSMTIQLTDRLTEMKRHGKAIIAFNIGEPDFNTPKNISIAGKKAIDEGFTKYTVVAGFFQLREAIAKKLKRENHVTYGPEEVIVCAGAKQALTNTLLTLCNPGDEVILITPCWVSYVEMIKLAGAIPVFVKAQRDRGFGLNLAQIEKAITEKTKAILINTPNNPSGAVYSEDELWTLGKLAVKHHFYIISDEIYEKLIYSDEKHVTIASLSPDIWDRTVTINGFSKTYAMTGWRLGYAAGPLHLIEGMKALQGHMTSGPNAIAQRAALEALLGSQEGVRNMVKEYDKRRQYLYNRINKIEGITCHNPKGAFYVFPNIARLYGKRYGNRVIRNSLDFAEFLLEYAQIAVVPGIAFEESQCIRMSYSTAMEKIVDGMDRMEEAMRLLQ